MASGEKSMQQETGYVAWGEFEGYKIFQPEHYLLLAILERAILDYVGPADTPSHYRRSAELFFRPNKSTRSFSFNWIAQHMHADPEWFKTKVRDHLARLLATKDLKVADKALCKAVETCNTIACESRNSEGHIHRWQPNGAGQAAKALPDQHLSLPAGAAYCPYPRGAQA